MRRRSSTECSCTYDDGVRKVCDTCKRLDFEDHASYCRCGQVVTNAAFFKKTSPHFKGTCRRWGAPQGLKIPERTVDKPLPYPMPKMPDYFASNGAYYTFIGKRNGQDFMAAHGGGTGINTYADLAKWWGLPTISDAPVLPEGEGRWIKALFAGNCVRGHKIEADERAFYYRESRQLLCADCGQRAAQRRAA